MIFILLFICIQFISAFRFSTRLSPKTENTENLCKRGFNCFRPQTNKPTSFSSLEEAKNQFKIARNQPLDQKSTNDVQGYLNLLKSHDDQAQKIKDDFLLTQISALTKIDKLDQPLKVFINDQPIDLLNYVSRGRFGVVFKGKFQKKDVAVKIFDRKTLDSVEFNREIGALKIIDKVDKSNKLVAYDAKKYIIVQKWIPGDSLYNILKSLDLQSAKGQKELEKLKEQYFGLNDQFYKKYGLIHGDIHPGNVMVDPKGRMHLIDFGKAEKPSSISDDFRTLSQNSQESIKFHWDLMVDINHFEKVVLKNPDGNLDFANDLYARLVSINNNGLAQNYWKQYQKASDHADRRRRQTKTVQQ